ncbi:phosphotransferase [Kineosporia sp. A_224]|uniref:phosphotransferase n=1 Tax=Kineosporia sp. A_224 TaxID=1962180 RepID=UPI0018E98797|nr:phosphotransferase [Kineosporia sp. A_224]
MHEEPLTGGNVAAAVVRVGDTVRKPVTAATPAVEALLRHLDAAGFDGAPRWVGRDASGRYVLEFVPGAVAHSGPPMPLDDLQRVGVLIRRLHDAVASFVPPADSAWDCPLPAEGSEIVCHNDLAPWNLVLDGDRWVFVDWDAAAPGTRLSDLAYAVHGFCGIAAGNDPDRDARRIVALADGYDLAMPDRLRLPDAVERRIRAMADLLAAGATSGEQPWARLFAEGHWEHWGPAADHAAAHRERWRRALAR